MGGGQKSSIFRRHSLWTTPLSVVPELHSCTPQIENHLEIRAWDLFYSEFFYFFFLIYFCTKSHAHKKIFSESTKVVTDASMGLSPVAQNPSKLIWNVNYCFSNVRFWQKTNKIYIMNSICWFGTSFYLDNDQNWAYNIYLLFRYNYSTMVLR